MGRGAGLDAAFAVFRTAQDATFPTLTPQSSPTGNGGAATWTLGEHTFASNYPFGMNFTLKATSSAGTIKGATALWKLVSSACSGVFNEQTQQWEFAWDLLEIRCLRGLAYSTGSYWSMTKAAATPPTRGKPSTKTIPGHGDAPNWKTSLSIGEHPIGDEFGKLVCWMRWLRSAKRTAPRGAVCSRTNRVPSSTRLVPRIMSGIAAVSLRGVAISA